jgi:hypothetical protein
MTLTAAGGKIPKDLSWAAGKKYMGNVDAFLKSLLNFDKDNVPVNCVDACEKEYLSNPGFSPDNIRSKSSAAAGLCAWVVNICKYFRIYQVSLALAVYSHCSHKGLKVGHLQCHHHVTCYAGSLACAAFARAASPSLLVS